MSESIAKHLLEDIDHNGLFSITIRHTECNNIVGLVIGGLSRKPRLNCFECDEMLGTDDCKIEVIEQ